MTTLMTDPIDHWLALPVATPRQPLRQEMWEAFEQAVNSSGHATRAYWTGVATGYAVAFGLFTRAALDNARHNPAVRVVNPLEQATFRDEEHAWSCGLLFGYKLGTSELPDADECGHCQQRLIERLDFPAYCQHGTFCEGCIADWHEPLPRPENCMLDADS